MAGIGRSKRSVAFVLALVAVAITFGSLEARPQSAATPAAAEGAPAQPSPPGEVPFNHQIHAGQYKMPCLDCHAFADKSPSAGLPSERKCMGCHKFVGKDKPGVQVLAKRFEEGQPIRWERVFAVPDFIYFSHRVHLAKKIECKECHGDVAAAKTLRQEHPFTMGRCLTCHEARNATRDCMACHK